MRVIKSLVLLFLATLVLTSCSDEGKEVFTGDVYVTLINNGTSEITEGEATQINYEVVLSKSFDKDVTLVFNLENISQYPNLVTLPTSVTVPKNKTKGALTITGVEKADIENILTDNKNFNVLLASYSGITNKITLDKDYTISVKKEEGFEPLTDAQKKLIEGYKSKGIDLTKWIGKIPVSTKITTGGNGYYAFETSEEKIYSGTTYITLSDNATADKPLLKMVNNAFGLNEYLQWVFRNETIENTEGWYTDDTSSPNYQYMGPAPKAVIAAIGDERYQKWKDKEYSFNVIVDDIEVKANKTVTFIYEKGAYSTYNEFVGTMTENKITAVNFQYEFPLWDELVELAKNNQDLTDNILQGGSLHPNNYITYSKINEDDWSETNWVTPTGIYTDTEMTFKFNSDHSNSGDYDIIEVTLTAK